MIDWNNDALPPYPDYYDVNTYGAAYTYGCYNQASDANNGGCSPLNDAQRFGQIVFDMYKTWYETDPLDCPTVPMTFVTHVRSNWDNASFLPGTCIMIFGDGYYKFHPLVSLDVVAHEMSHGVTDQTSGLIYNDYDSGALNEAFSDMGGKAAERYARGYDANTFNWGIGYDITKATYNGGAPLRCMDNPLCDGRSIDHVGNYNPPINNHLSSGIFNKVITITVKSRV